MKLGNHARLTEGPVHRHLVSLTSPMILGILAMMMFNVVDTWFVAQLGARPLAAMSFTFPVVMVLTGFGIGLMAGTSSILARVIGAGDTARARRLTTDAGTLAVISAIAFSVIGIATMDELFALLGASPEVIPLIRDYMGIWFAGFVFVLVPMVGMGAIRATGDTRLQSKIIVIAALINLVLDPLLIFGLLGFPRLEIQGAAIATVIARIISLLIGTWYIHFRFRMLTTPVQSPLELWQSWKQVLHVGLPAAGTNMIIPVSAGIIVALLARFGEHAVAGFGAAMRIEAVTLVVYFAMSAVIGPFVGQNLGARKPSRIGTAIRQSAAFCIALGVLIALMLGVFAPQLSRLFSDDPEVIAVSSAYLRIVPASYGLAGIVMVVNAAFNGVGMPFPAVMVSVIRTLILYVPLAYVAANLFGVSGIFAATCFSNVVCGIIAYAWYQHTCRTRFASMAPEPAS